MATGAFSQPSPPPVSSSAQPAAPPAGYDLAVEEQLRKTRVQVKLVDIVSNCLLLVAGALGYMLLVAVVDHWIFALGFWTRLFALAVLIGGAGWWLAVRILPLVVRRINPVYAAYTIEQAEPSLKNSLINFLLLRGQREKIHAVVYQALGQRAARDIAHVPAENIVDHSHLLRIGYVLAALLVVGAIYKIASPKDPFQSVARVVAPWASIERPSRVDIEDVQPGDVSIFQGEQVDVSAIVRGAGNSEKVEVLFSSLDGQIVDRQAAMQLDEAGLRYTAKVPGDEFGAQTSLQYKIVAGDAQTRWHNVEVVPAPHVLVTKIEYAPPAYTKREKEEDGRGDVDGLEGTLVTIHARANREIESATLEFDPLPDGVSAEARAAAGAESKRITRIDGQNLQTSFYLRLKSDRKTPWHKSYTIRINTADGYRNRQPIVYSIDVQPDLAPLAEILEPDKADIELPLNRKLDVEVRAIDHDFLLSKVRLVAVSGARDLLDVALMEAPTGRKGQVIQKFEFVPARYGLAVGDEVEYWAVAEDNRTAVQTGLPEPNVARSTPNYRITIVEPEPEKRDPRAKDDDGAGDMNHQPMDNSQSASKPDGNPQNSGENGGQQGDNQTQKSNDRPQDGGDQSGDTGAESGGQSSNDSSNDNSDSESTGNEADSNAGGEGGSQGNKSQGNKSQGNKSQGSNSQGNNSQGNNSEGNDSQGQNSNESNAGQSGSRQSTGESGGNSASGGQSPSGAQNGDQPSEPLENDGSRDGDIFDAINEHRRQQEDLRDQVGSDDQNNDGQNRESTGNQQNQDQTGEQSDGQSGAQSQDDQSGQQGAGQKSSGGQTGPKDQQNQSGSQSGGAGEQQGEKPNQGAGGGEQNAGGQQSGQKQDGGASSEQEQNAGGQSAGQQQGEKPNGGDQSQQNQGGANDQEQNQNASGNDSAGGQPQGGAKPEGQKNQSGGEGQQSQGGGMGQNDKSGAGQETDGGGSPQSQAENEQQRNQNKQGGGAKQGGQNQQQGGKSPAGSNKDSQSQGESGGDRKGGGEQGGGQSSQQQGQDSAGSSSSGEQGDGAAQQQGSGQAGNRGGGDQIASSPTGRSGEQAGEGSRSGSAEGGQRDQNQPQDGQQQQGPSSQSGDRTGGGQPRDDATGNPSGEHTSATHGQGRTGQPSGGLPADDRPPPAPQPDVEPGGDKANLEYARKATDLTLEYLKDQKQDPDRKLLDKLGWTRDELNTFIERWERMKRSAKTAGESSDAARRLDDSLRGLGLRPPRDKLRAGPSGEERLDRQRDAATRTRPPKEYEDQSRAFSKFVAPAE